MTRDEVTTTNTEDLGTVLIDGQPLDEGGLPFDMTIRLDSAGRSQLTKALLSGIDLIEVCGTFGEIYTLTLRSIDAPDA